MKESTRILGEVLAGMLEKSSAAEAEELLRILTPQSHEREVGEWLDRVISTKNPQVGQMTRLAWGDFIAALRQLGKERPEFADMLMLALRRAALDSEKSLQRRTNAREVLEEIRIALRNVDLPRSRKPSMSNQMHQFTYSFHAVGQGLFASGLLQRNISNSPVFQWVYDCGSSSSEHLIDEAMARLSEDTIPRKFLDLVTLSHFDHDHISGICRLAKEFKINTLMLPYMAQERRLWIAFEERIQPDDPLMGFFVNPTAYLSALGGPGIRKILYVQAGGDEAPPEQPGEPPKESGPTEEGDWQMKIEDEKPPDSNDPALKGLDQGPVVTVLPPGRGIRLGIYWEFMPYNDDTKTPASAVPASFRTEVESLREKLISGASEDPEREEALEGLKEIYKHQFGKRSEDVNIISLFLYAGPIYSTWNTTSIQECHQTDHPHPDWHWHSFQHSSIPSDSSRSSLLYTGDGYLHNHERLQRLINILKRPRVERIGVLQVMHHGSETNWHKGVAEAFNPLVSVFSSDPNRRKWGHPHPAVLRDFWDHSPLQADKTRSAKIQGVMKKE